MQRDKVEEAKKLLRELSPSEREAILQEIEEPGIPMFMWNSNLNGFKAALKYLEQKDHVYLADLKTYLRKLGYVQDPSNRFNFGIIYDETGIFKTDPKAKAATLTPTGEKLAALFDDDHSTFSIIETIILRGLQQQSAGYAYLHLVARNPGILREQLQEKLVQLYGGKGRYYTGYYTRLFSQLELIKKKRDGRKMSYYIKVPEAWWQKIPKNES